jgi:NADPH2:quinone reductase
MGKLVFFDQTGEPSVFKVGTANKSEPKSDEVLIRQTAIGVNFFDALVRQGKYPQYISQGQNICGTEACGIIEKIGTNVQGFDLGQRVAYATTSPGAYQEFRCVNAKHLVTVPEGISDKMVVACLAKALTAHYLAFRVYIVRSGVAVLIHSAASAVGQLLAQWCNNLGAVVIGTVGSEHKREVALQGCHYVFNYKTEEWVGKVKEITKGVGVNVVYDSLGAATFNKSLDCLIPIGLMVLYGQSSGPVAPIDPQLLWKKSLFLTCPSLFEYKKNRMELILSANEVFKNIIDGKLKINIAAEFPLEQAAEAHMLLETGTSTGSIILVP